MLVTPNMNGIVNRANYGKRSTSPRPLLKAIPLPTVPNMAPSRLSHHSSSDNLTKNNAEDEPIYDVPPCFDNNWDSSQTLPRPSALHIENDDSMHSRTSTISSLSTINSCTSVATLTNHEVELPVPLDFPDAPLRVEIYQRSPGSNTNSRSYEHSHSYTANCYPESPNEYSKAEQSGSAGDKRKRSKSKNRSLLHRSGSVLKSMFSSSSDEVSGKASNRKAVEAILSVDVNPQPSCHMQGRLLFKEIRNIRFEELTAESLSNFEVMPWQSVTIFTSHSQLHMQKSHSVPQSDDGVSLDLVGARCEPIMCQTSSLPKKSKEHKSRHVSASVTSYAFKIQLQNDFAVVRVFQTDSKESMTQWVSCLQSISQMTPVSNSQSVSHAPSSPMHGASSVFLDCYQMSPSFPNVPVIVTDCCEKIEELGGLHVTGIYRVPGNSLHINSLLNQINTSLTHLNLSNADVHTIASALKTFLRRLPEPLITNDWYSSLIVANRKREETERLDSMRRVINQLPTHNLETLKYLMRHLDKIAKHSEENKMDVTNLATVFGPTLLRSPSSSDALPGPSGKGAPVNQKDDMISIWGDMLEQRSIIEAIISHQTYLFGTPVKSNEHLRTQSSHVLPDVVKDTGFQSQMRRDSNVSINSLTSSLTSAAQMHLNCTASAVRKMSSEKLTAISGASRKVSSAKVAPNAKHSPVPVKAEFTPVSREASPIPRRSKSMSDKAEKLSGKRPNEECSEADRADQDYSSTDYDHNAPQSFEASTASSLSLNAGSEANYFQSQRMLKDLDSLIESLKAECKETDDKVRRSAEEGEAIFDNFCKLFTSDGSRSSYKSKSKQNLHIDIKTSPSKESQSSISGSGDLEHLIARELDAKIANLRLEYTFKVDTVPPVELQQKGDMVVETAIIDDSGIPEKAEVTTFLENPSYDVEKKNEYRDKTDSKVKEELSSRVSTQSVEQKFIKLDTDKISRRIEASLKMRNAEFGERQPSVYENVVEGSTNDEVQNFLPPNTSIANTDKSQNQLLNQPQLLHGKIVTKEAKATPTKPVPTFSSQRQSYSVDHSYPTQTSPQSSPTSKHFKSPTMKLTVDVETTPAVSPQEPATRRSPFKSIKSESVSGTLKSVIAPLRPHSKSRNKQNTVSSPTSTSNAQSTKNFLSDRAPFPLSSNPSGSADFSSRPIVNSTATPSRSNRGSLNPAHLVQSSVDSSVNLSSRNINSASTTSSMAIDRSASRSWVTRSNPDLLTAAANKSGSSGNSRRGNATPGTPSKVSPNLSSSGHATPNPKQLMIFHTSQV
ncbi:uncharacterized protein LOC142352090 [Convolutriloba macropyga]|uniref:uncharacterized protein LOC142352090 n=1 Tax=Convolutriloba macropyga TaxID=536237 RepID=UPI003F51C98B